MVNFAACVVSLKLIPMSAFLVSPAAKVAIPANSLIDTPGGSALDDTLTSPRSSAPRLLTVSSMLQLEADPMSGERVYRYATCSPPDAILFRITVVSVGTWAADAVAIVVDPGDFVAAVGDRNPPRDGVVAGSTCAAEDGSSVPRSSSRSRLVAAFFVAASGFFALPGLLFLGFLTCWTRLPDGKI